MLKKIALLAFAFSAFTVLPALAAPPAPPPGLPTPKILVINRQAILQASKVGQDIARQMQTFATQAKADVMAQEKALTAEGQALQQQVAILAPDARQKKIDAFQAKEAALQASTQRKEQAMQYTLLQAQQTVANTIKPILLAIMQQRGANIILDAQSVMLVNAQGFDITGPVIDQLNQKLPSLKVTIQNPPAGPGK